MEVITNPLHYHSLSEWMLRVTNLDHGQPMLDHPLFIMSEKPQSMPPKLKFSIITY